MESTESNDTPTVLVIDDQPVELNLMLSYLEDFGVNVLVAESCETGFQRACKELPDLILLDVRMPGGNGFDVCRRLKANEQTSMIPVIFMSALISVNDKISGFAAGGVDYLTKPVDRDETRARVKTHLTLHRLQKTLLEKNERLRKEILERERAELELKKSEENYRTIFDSVNDAIFIHDMETGAIVDVNAKMLEMYGFPDKSAVVGYFPKNLSSEKPPYTEKDAMKWIEKASGGEPQLFEWCAKNASGNPFWVEVSLKRVVIGGEDRIIAVVRDIDNRKKAEEELIESEARHRAFFTSKIAAMSLFEIETGRFIDVNDAFLYLYGYTKEEALGMTVADITAEPEATKGAVAKSSKTGAVYISERRHRKKDGTEFIVDIHAGPFVLKGKKLMYAMITDITDRKLAEQELRENEERYRSLFDNEIEAICIFEVDSRRIIDVNRAFVELYGYSREELLKLKAEDVSAEPESTKAAILESKENGSMTISERRHRKKDGTLFWVELSGGPFTWKGRKLMYVMLRDITYRKHADEHLKKAKEEAEAASYAKTVFLSNMSHELRTPLNAILGFSELMTRDENLTEQQQENLKTILGSGEHLLSLINDVLDFSKIEAGKVELNPENFDLSRMLDNLESMFRMRTLEKGMEMIVERSPNLPRFVSADQNKLRQILINLLGNSVKFTESGSITLRVEYGESKTGQDDSILRFEVEDTGPGIPKDELDTVFEAFFQTPDARRFHQGTGLGLPISRHFASMMGGNISVRSEVGKGSLFQVEIRIGQAIAPDKSAEASVRRVTGLEPGQPAYRILVVEDKETNRRLLVSLMEKIGFEVRGAVDGSEGVKIWKQWRPHFVWMDIRMPVMNGYEATKRIRELESSIPEQEKRTPIVALTASAFEEERIRILECGCDDYIRKPYRENMIFDMMKNHIGARLVYDDACKKDEANAEKRARVAESIQSLPDEIRSELKNAAESIDYEKALSVIEQIQTHDRDLAGMLGKAVENYRFDKLTDLLKRKPDATENSC